MNRTAFNYKKPYITIALVAMNTVIFFLCELFGNTQDTEFMIRCGACYPPLLQTNGEYWRLLTAMFLHFGIEHLANNMIMLAAAGNVLEDALGHVKFLILYLVSGLCGNGLSYYLALRSGENPASAGASGAIFGVVGALIWLVAANRGHYKSLTPRGMAFLVGLTLLFGFTTSGVDNAAHIGGIISGLILSVILYRKNRNGYNSGMNNNGMNRNDINQTHYL